LRGGACVFEGLGAEDDDAALGDEEGEVVFLGGGQGG